MVAHPLLVDEHLDHRRQHRRLYHRRARLRPIDALRRSFRLRDSSRPYLAAFHLSVSPRWPVAPHLQYGLALFHGTYGRMAIRQASVPAVLFGLRNGGRGLLPASMVPAG